jgi:hypothetical protein
MGPHDFAETTLSIAGAPTLRLRVTSDALECQATELTTVAFAELLAVSIESSTVRGSTRVVQLFEPADLEADAVINGPFDETMLVRVYHAKTIQTGPRATPKWLWRRACAVTAADRAAGVVARESVSHAWLVACASWFLHDNDFVNGAFFLRTLFTSARKSPRMRIAAAAELLRFPATCMPWADLVDAFASALRGLQEPGISEETAIRAIHSRCDIPEIARRYLERRYPVTKGLVRRLDRVAVAVIHAANLSEQAQSVLFAVLDDNTAPVTPDELVAAAGEWLAFVRADAAGGSDYQCSTANILARRVYFAIGSRRLPRAYNRGSAILSWALFVVDMTRKRLWFLHQLAGLVKAEVERLAVWSRGQIDAGLDRYDLCSCGSESYWVTNAYIDREIARFLHLDEASIPTLEQTIDLRHALQDRLRDALVRGPIDWAAIDAFPWPGEVLEDHSR